MERYGTIVIRTEEGTFAPGKKMKNQKQKSIRARMNSYEGRSFCEWIYTKMMEEGRIREETT